MILKGKLCLSHDKDDYIIFAGGRTTNLSEYLNSMLFENVKFVLTHSYSGKVLFDVEGKLLKQRTSKCFYLYHVGKFNADSVLWNLVGNKLEFEIRNIDKR